MRQRIIYGGRFDGSQTAGSGVTTGLLISHGIDVFSDREIEQLIERVEYCDRHADA
ncbi:hypothetical protein O1Q74_07075 [Pectobacterium sp. A5351]|nr:hypothetical protein [Pectobacterium sp. A5351]WCG84394.1 hypothetical protein O1Q74_07075 [Pectobacterium sp. A5351]